MDGDPRGIDAYGARHRDIDGAQDEVYISVYLENPNAWYVCSFSASQLFCFWGAIEAASSAAIFHDILAFKWVCRVNCNQKLLRPGESCGSGKVWRKELY